MKKIEQIIKQGNISLSIKSKYLTKEEVEEFLINNSEVNVDSLLAFYVLRKYHNNLNSVTEKRPEFKLLIDKKCPESLKEFYEIHKNSINLILSRTDPENEEEARLCVRTGDDVAEVKGSTIESTVKMCIDCDRLDNIIQSNFFCEVLIDQIIDRTIFLKENLNDYFENVVKKDYEVVVKNQYIYHMFHSFTREKIVKLNQLYPDIIDLSILELDDLKFRASLMNPITSGYVLGLPVHLFVPNLKQIFSAIDLLQTSGIEKYKRKIVKYNEKSLKSILFFEEDDDDLSKTHNEEDSMFEKCTEYSPLDLVFAKFGEHQYLFTAPEFQFLEKSDVNLYTKSKLQCVAKSEIMKRNQIRSRLRITNTNTVERLLENFLDNKDVTEYAIETVVSAFSKKMKI